MLEALPVNGADDPTVLLEPLLTAMRKERYNYIKAVYIWDIPLTNKETTALVRDDLINSVTSKTSGDETLEVVLVASISSYGF